MENRWQVAISAGLLAAIWCGVADAFHLVTWIGFLGCSTFFAQPKAGFQGVMMAWCTNLSGVFWAWLIISGSSFFVSPVFGYIFTGIATSAMCLQASYQKLSFIPGAFIGCCITFAMAGDIANILPPLIIGGLLGWGMSMLTEQLVALTPKWSAPTGTEMTRVD
ncbi:MULTISPECIES: DUF1097 domain-containing protein [Shewanella]|jgi:hypothetical protein|uniref:DUF1097 domain-containing protein n=2 Tax=Shewanella putrefaciens TaxID=24 RepID=A4Y861_SHEPC|nr:MULTISPECIES: DUF1097 domain-containing protein [Shewanella]CAD6364128.1 Inner membrane protein YcdZ [Shewanella hafniensis]ABM24422.1 protein of unknown function DUF1097 [Shewanella sp. W3-18-1]AVV86172.1 hypothetical protein SPWS13_4500 [Shewanella putrefaciens]MCK7629708.1 DUF1097 domain-containing protein [Shewanella sp. JNE9-1]MCK7644844.1 DUF1097 domain-containing protein [Shewanella sp. JNE3-1]